MESELRQELYKLSHQTDSKGLRLAIETLITIYRNIKQHPGDPKYRKLNTSNKSFYTKVWQHGHAADFLLASGWEVFNMGEEIRFVQYEEDNINMALHILLQNRNVNPAEDEWDENKKYEGKSLEQLREEDLKKKATEERKRQLAAYMEDKKKRETLAAYVKAESKADRERLRHLRGCSSSSESK